MKHWLKSLGWGIFSFFILFRQQPTGLRKFLKSLEFYILVVFSFSFLAVGIVYTYTAVRDSIQLIFCE